MIKKTIYLSGAMGCYKSDNDYPYKWRSDFERILKNTSEHNDYYNTFEIFDPTMYYDYLENVQYTDKEVLRYEMRKVENSNIVVVNLKDIDKSVGTVCEVMNAYMNGIPILGFCDSSVDYLKEVHPWIIEMCDRIEFGHTDEDAIGKTVYYILGYY